MGAKETTLHGCHRAAPKRPCQDRAIITDYDRATLAAGLLIAVSFGLMFLVGGWMGW